jgi:hypothetical protein
MHLIDMILNAWTFVHLFQHIGIIAPWWKNPASGPVQWLLRQRSHVYVWDSWN